ncbi:MAG: CAP domain-containing protein [Paenisporosarcina sp.]
MKVLVRILIILAIIITVFLYSDQSVKENDILKAPFSSGQAIPQVNLQPPSGENTIPRPTSGLSTMVGKNAKDFVSLYGDPNRIESSAFGYKWWVYNESFSKFMMIGVTEDGTINQVYIAGKQLDATPFAIQQSIDELYRFTIIQSEISVQIGLSTYTFTISDEDLRNRILVEFNDLYAQVYVDQEDKEIEAIRFTDSKTLVLHQPYEMVYKGDFIAPPVPSTNRQKEIDETNERQTLDLTNVYRIRHSIGAVENEKTLGLVARKHSEDMALQNYFSHESPDFGNLEDRLEEAKINYVTAGENIGANYYDSAEVIHGWLNSSDHRKMLLNKNFTHLGSGAFGKYYTQNFIQKTIEDTYKSGNQ